ncbi:MAG: hypothetical protein LUC94_11870 [Clostridiales bacterium]|nr:hypothetical protein [Clostridiales bacterium]
MKRLWLSVPPCMSDVLGFQAVMEVTKGAGIVDDSSQYKPLPQDRTGAPEGHGRHDRHGDGREGHRERRGVAKEYRERYERRAESGKSYTGTTPGVREEKTRRRGIPFNPGKLFPGVRVVSSEIEETDVITGSDKKVARAAQLAEREFHPDFMLFTTAPCASMIASDLDQSAEKVQDLYGIPAAVVKLDGQKDYLYGISCTLLAMGKLLLKKQEKIPGTVNLLGLNKVDWTDEMLWSAEEWLDEAGIQVLSRWGMQEKTERLRTAAGASVNLVVGVAGMRLAVYMEREFGIPYIVGAPFGNRQCGILLSQLKAVMRGESVAPVMINQNNPEADKQAEPEILILGEQMLGNAIRNALETEEGNRRIRVCSFYEFDKKLARPGDRKLFSEEELAGQLVNPSLRVVFGDEDYWLEEAEAVQWIALPNRANLAPSTPMEPVNLVGVNLDLWLKHKLEV